MTLASLSTDLLPALGCAVCFGEAEGAALQGLWWAAAVLTGLVYGLLAVFGFFIWRARRRAKSPVAGDP